MNHTWLRSAASCLGALLLSCLCSCEENEDDASLDGQWDVQVRGAAGAWSSVGTCKLREEDDAVSGWFTLNDQRYDTLEGDISDSTVTLRVYGGLAQATRILTFTGFWDEDDTVLGTLRIDADDTTWTARLVR